MEIVPDKIWVQIDYSDNRIPILLIMGSDVITGADFSFSDFTKIFDNWVNCTGPFKFMDWDTDDDAWSLSFTMDLYHAWRSPQRWLSSTINIILDGEDIFPHWVVEPGDNTIWAMIIKLEDYHS